MNTISQQVGAQYSVYPYPAPVSDLEQFAAEGRYLGCDPSLFAPLIWPEGQPRKDLNILVAGCGTNEAATIAYNNPQCSVLGIDLSDASLAHTEYLRNKHRLSNLVLERRDLRDPPREKRFDYIVCSGVLHHLENPADGLRALAGALEPHGSAFLMLYGRAARAGVYLLQDIFRRLGTTQTAEGVTFVRDTLAHLPSYHYARAFMERAADLGDDAAIVDTYLHVQDRAYSVPEVLSLVRGAGLRFQSWRDNGRYSIDNLPGGGLLRVAAKSLPPEDQWAVVESVTLTIDKHVLLVCRPERDSTCLSMSFAGDEFLNVFPVRHPKFAIARERVGDKIEVIRETNKFTISSGGAVLLLAADGRRTVREILELKQLAAIPWDQRVEAAQQFFQHMWQNGHLFISKVRQ